MTVREIIQSVDKGDYQTARARLSAGGDLFPDAWHLLSLLHQHDGLYDEERRIIDRATSLFPAWQYGQERKKWHTLPMFHKCVPRPPLHLERNPDVTPRAETIEQLCIVLTSDSRYLMPLVECIESIQATRYYADVPICLVDGGLTEDELLVLRLRYGITKVEKVERHLEAMGIAGMELTSHVKVLLSRCFPDRIFPGYRYYLYIDADAWVHDERGFDKFACQAEQCGVAVTAPGMPFSSSEWPGRKILCAEDTRQILDRPFLAGTAYCIDASGLWFDAWQANIRKIISRGIPLQYGIDEATLNFMCHDGGITDFLGMTELHSLWWFIPVASESNPYHLFDATGSIGLVHITSAFLCDACCYMPTQCVEGPLEDPQAHFKTSMEILTQLRAGALEKTKYFEKQINISTHYRVWPWQGRERLKSQIGEVGQRLLDTL